MDSEMNYSGQKHPHHSTIYYPNGRTEHTFSDPIGTFTEESFIDFIRMADDSAEKGDGYSKDEWESMPEQYVAECFKECYSNQIMQKGHVLEFGVRGVYVCMGCGYAYPPMSEPCEINEDSIRKMKEEINLNDDDDYKEFLEKQLENTELLLNIVKFGGLSFSVDEFKETLFRKKI